MRARILAAWLRLQVDRLRTPHHRGMRYRVWWVGSFFVLAALLCGCATAPKPAPPDAGLDYAMAVEDFRLLHIHEARP